MKGLRKTYEKKVTKENQERNKNREMMFTSDKRVLK